MLKLLPVILLLIIPLSLGGQDVMPSPAASPSVTPHTHQGLYLSMSAGPVFGNVSDNMSTYEMNLKGTGALFDFKIGGTVGRNFILHATLLSQLLTGPRIVMSNGTSSKASDNLNVGEGMFGCGFTYYLMPSDMFVSASAGLGNFSIIDNTDSKNNFSTQEGFSMQLKIGREWWISSRWAFGIAFTYGKTRLTNRPGGGITEKLDSNRFGVVFNATLN